ncbi:PilZ domain-containing protein [Sphingomonas pokkalii]|uniref:PilZ domain-containing protein n=1 Tax=Sphingomonas pokkalii TaxID=2175090 RepID=A0A2U0SCJ3_9SPHN|nr:PilZ domain-containing protein [Sphingomonas pokkalii]PVX29096.1 PilZ domain-containing protein [Sphingomonas pokkalii]
MDQQSYIPASALSADDFAGKRSGARDSLLLTAQLRVDGEAVGQVRVRNLSAGGLMAEYPEPIGLRAPVEIEVRGVGWVSGKIAWAAEGRVGVAFDHEIDPKLARKPVGGGAQTPAYVKPLITRR